MHAGVVFCGYPMTLIKFRLGLFIAIAHCQRLAFSSSCFSMELRMQTESNLGPCTFCGTRIRGGVFAICREVERKRFNEPLGPDSPEVEVRGLRNIAQYCSNRCRSVGRNIAMSAERIRLPATPPSIGPIEVCSNCGNVVDMTRWHLVYVQCNDSTPTHADGVYDVKELAVLCRTCAPV